MCSDLDDAFIAMIWSCPVKNVYYALNTTEQHHDKDSFQHSSLTYSGTSLGSAATQMFMNLKAGVAVGRMP